MIGKMVTKLKEMALYIAILAALFYLVPPIIGDTGTAMFILLIFIPLFTFALSILLGWRKGMNWLFPIAVWIIFFPTVFLYYNSSAWVYSVVYAAIGLVGVVVGSKVMRKLFK